MHRRQNRNNRQLALEIVVGLAAFLLLFVAFEAIVLLAYIASGGST